MPLKSQVSVSGMRFPSFNASKSFSDIAAESTDEEEEEEVSAEVSWSFAMR